jgi:hypothetical protein
MSYRFDAPLITGAYHFGNRGLGVLGSAIPTTSDHGGAVLANDLVLPNDLTREIRCLLVTSPSSDTLVLYEDGSFTFSAPDGTYSFVYRLFEDGMDKGTATVTVTIG